MPTWMKTTPMMVANGFEKWISSEHLEESYAVYVRRGKPLDIMSLKRNVLDDFGSQVAHISSTRSALFASGHTENVERCPICGSSAVSSKCTTAIYGGRYQQCSMCSHYFVVNRPSKETLEKFYATDTHYSSTYTDKRLNETRVRQVAMPKAEWMAGEFQRMHGRPPKSVLDVGAGGGHFVWACEQLGMKSRGIELSQSSREFCKNNFGIELSAEDFTSDWNTFSDVDVVTFWGILEHVPNPMALLRAAHQALNREGLVVASVPRWDCLSTAVQCIFSGSVVRHLDPLGHISLFTDNSIATAFENSGFAPAAAWYFGMDAYELIMQLSYLLEPSTDSVTNTLAKYIPSLQAALDHGQLTDEIALAGTPLPCC